MVYSKIWPKHIKISFYDNLTKTKSLKINHFKFKVLQAQNYQKFRQRVIIAQLAKFCQLWSHWSFRMDVTRDVLGSSVHADVFYKK